MHYHFDVSGTDFTIAGNASAQIKKILQERGIIPEVIKRTAVAMYEAEVNMAVHAGGGEVDITIEDDKIFIVMTDKGHGIANLEEAMQEGYSTAPEIVRELGFGAGMGLSNMKRNSDYLQIDTHPQRGTTVTMTIKIR